MDFQAEESVFLQEPLNENQHFCVDGEISLIARDRIGKDDDNSRAIALGIISALVVVVVALVAIHRSRSNLESSGIVIERGETGFQERPSGLTLYMSKRIRDSLFWRSSAATVLSTQTTRQRLSP